MKYLVLDGNSILNRAFYGIRMLSNKKGQMTNAIYGFLSTLQKLMSEVNPTAVAVAFDLAAPTFRHKMFDGYKAGRKRMPEELASQLPILKELLIALGYRLISCEGYEADDILGTFGKYCEKNSYECVIATGDRDSLQLISPLVSVRIAKTKFGKSEAIFYDEEKVIEEYGVAPAELIDVKALQGDISDNIPGVKGIGQKTATELIAKYKSIKYIYENIDTLDIKSSVKSKLISDKENAFMSYELGKINKDVPIEIKDKDFIPVEMNHEKVVSMLTELEFFSFIEKMNLNHKSSENSEINLEICDNEKKLNVLYSKIESMDFISLYFQTEEKVTERLLRNVYICDGNSCYVLKNYEFIEKLFKLKKLKKIVYNLKDISKILKNVSYEDLLGTFDVMLAAYVLNPSGKNYEPERLAKEFEISLPSFANSKEIESNFDYKCAIRSYILNKIYTAIKSELESKNQIDLLFSIEQPLSLVLADMETVGIEVDKIGIENYGKVLQNQILILENSIYSMASMDFNINSPKQLGFVLFEKLGLPKGKKGKTGYSTSADTLEKLKNTYEIVDLILQYRALSKLKSTYCDGIVKLKTPDNRIHSSFNQTETRTGRISSTEPNLQNIPVRTAKGRELRKFFKAREGSVLIDADYSQVELRVMAHISGDKNMINAFNNSEDIHSITAAQIFGIPQSMVTSEMRSSAKAINFGILYGMGAYSLSEDLKISIYDAKNYINKYLSHYSGIDNYMKNIIEKAKNDGYVETIFHRRRYLPELSSTNHNLRAFGERVARNMPIQGSAADIIKIAMINVYNELRKENLKSKLILQVHDELIVESPMDESKKVKEILKYSMENAFEMAVPLEVHISMGKTWFDAKD